MARLAKLAPVTITALEIRVQTIETAQLILDGLAVPKVHQHLDEDLTHVEHTRGFPGSLPEQNIGQLKVRTLPEGSPVVPECRHECALSPQTSAHDRVESSLVGRGKGLSLGTANPTRTEQRLRPQAQHLPVVSERLQDTAHIPILTQLEVPPGSIEDHTSRVRSDLGRQQERVFRLQTIHEVTRSVAVGRTHVDPDGLRLVERVQAVTARVWFETDEAQLTQAQRRLLQAASDLDPHQVWRHVARPSRHVSPRIPERATYQVSLIPTPQISLERQATAAATTHIRAEFVAAVRAEAHHLIPIKKLQQRIHHRVRLPIGVRPKGPQTEWRPAERAFPRTLSEAGVTLGTGDHRSPSNRLPRENASDPV